MKEMRFAAGVDGGEMGCGGIARRGGRRGVGEGRGMRRKVCGMVVIRRVR